MKQKEKKNVEEEGLFSLEKPYPNVTKEELAKKLDKKSENKMEISHFKKDELLFIANELNLDIKTSDSKIKIINSIKKTETPIEVINVLVKKFNKEPSENKNENQKLLEQKSKGDTIDDKKTTKALETTTSSDEKKKRVTPSVPKEDRAQSNEGVEPKINSSKEKSTEFTKEKKEEFEYAFMIADLSKTIEGGDEIYSLTPPIFNEDNTVTLKNSFKQGVMSEIVLGKQVIVGKYKELFEQTEFYLEAGILIKIVPCEKWMHLEESKVKVAFERQLLKQFRKYNKKLPSTPTPTPTSTPVKSKSLGELNNSRESFKERFLKHQKQ
jgi:hypothetical protein